MSNQRLERRGPEGWLTLTIAFTVCVRMIVAILPAGSLRMRMKWSLERNECVGSLALGLLNCWRQGRE